MLSYQELPTPILIKNVQNSIFQNSLFKRGERIVVAVSGGPDSVCLLDVFVRLKKKYSLGLIIAHVNYGLREKDSQKDETHAKRLAEKYALEIFISRPETKDHSEENLRNIRYAFFESIREKEKFDHIAVAHNSDDQVETFIMRLIRGAGINGLAAMRPKNRKIIRPLLETSRSEILEYLKNNGLSYRVDKTNLGTDFFRNKVRNKLIPELERKYNPNIKRTLLEMTRNIADDYDYIKTIAKKEHRKNPDLEISKLLKLHPAILKGVLREAISRKNPALKNITSAHIKEIIKAAKSTKNKSQVVVFQGLNMSRKGDKLKIS